jgi:hypothetical protein
VDVHIAELTVRETLDFSARCQGPGYKVELLTELMRREKEKGIIPDPLIDAYMKVFELCILAANTPGIGCLHCVLFSPS